MSMTKYGIAANGQSYEGTMTGRGFVGKVYVRKADIPQGVLEIISTVKLDDSRQWQEISTWRTCKLVARKVGAVTRYAQQHYGQYDCCLKAEIELSGAATYGISKASMTIWMRASLDAYWPKTWPKGKVLSWTRTSMDTAKVVVQDSVSNVRYEIKVERGLTDGSNIVRSLGLIEASRRLSEYLNAL